MWSLHEDRALREEAMRWLEFRSGDGAEALASAELADFTFRGQRVPLMDRQRGIRKPAFLEAALSMRTVYRPEGAARPYEDAVGSDGFTRYKWRGDDPNHAENRALRKAMVLRLPLIWFCGVGPGLYVPVFPVYLAAEEPELQQFVLAVDETYGLRPQEGTDSASEAVIRRYVRRYTKQRLHQPVFRGMVLRAYETRCSVCSLSHSRLLDAAHIVPDRDELGEASVRNGLAMCKLHHAAYDGGFMGIRPDLVVEIAHDLLEEVDGPMLKHGLQERHHEKLMVLPRSRHERPSPELLEIQYEAFLERSGA